MRGADRSLAGAIRGPITLITVGALFALNNFTPYGFGQTWPVLLIVFGLLSLLRRAVPAAPGGYPSPGFPYPPYPTYPSAPPPAPPTPPPAPGHGGYRDSQYGQTAPGASSAAGPVKGGFGSSATPPPAPPEGEPK